MVTLTKAPITIAATLLVITSIAMGITSAVWNLIALPTILCILLLTLAVGEYLKAATERHDNVHCILKYLGNVDRNDDSFHQDVA